MTRVTDYGELSARLGQLLFAGGATNGLPKSEAIRREIAAGTLFREDLPGGILLVQQRLSRARSPSRAPSWSSPGGTGTPFSRCWARG